LGVETGTQLVLTPTRTTSCVPVSTPYKFSNILDLDYTALDVASDERPGDWSAVTADGLTSRPKRDAFVE
jgi:hypothetical protein